MKAIGLVGSVFLLSVNPGLCGPKDPWRACEARLRRLGTERGSASATTLAPWRRWKAVACVSPDREVIVACDFFPVPSVSFQLLYWF
jgi:hypothetical protein